MAKVKKIIFWGDGLLSGPNGFAELLVNHIFLHNPNAAVSTSIYGGGNETWLDVARETPLHVIGKAPDLVAFNFGLADLISGKSPEEVAIFAQNALTMATHKTQTKICLLSLISSFVADEKVKAASLALNMHFQKLNSDRIAYIDLDSRVSRFLNQHRESLGEKHSLHLDMSRLTPLGGLFLAHHAFHMMEWPNF